MFREHIHPAGFTLPLKKAEEKREGGGWNVRETTSYISAGAFVSDIYEAF